MGFLGEVVSPGSTVVSDGWDGYAGATRSGYGHVRLVQGKANRAHELLPLVHTVFSNFKAWLTGTFHGVSRKWLPLYVREFGYRFNRRHREPSLFHYLLRRLVRQPWIPASGVLEARPVAAAAAK